jgi:NAD-dependent deacetylase
MFGESVPNYRFIYDALENSELFVAIGTSGQVIDIVELAKNVSHSILINPKQEEHITMFGSFDRTIDSYFSDFIQKGAVDASEELEQKIIAFLEDK